MFGLGLLFGFLLWKKLAKEEDIDSVVILEYYLVGLIGVFVGCRLFHVFVYNPSYFLSNPVKIIAIWEGGLSSHGGMIGGPLAVYFYTKKKNLDFWKLLDLITVPVVLSSAFIRIGNFLNGELVGRITTMPWGVKFNNFEGLRHPVQLYESAKIFFIFGVLYFYRTLKFPKGAIFWGAIFLFSFLRFFTEFFKEYLVFSFGLTIGQWISLGLCVISGVILYLLFTKKLVLGKS
jgi:prolipoprotein diacylglyceryl transferase